MTVADTLEQGRRAFRKQKWSDGYALLVSADNERQLDPDDLKQLATAAYLVGKESECTELWARAHQKYMDQEKIQQASLCAFWLGMILFFQGDTAQGGGWIARAGRTIENNPQECAEKGFLLIPKGLQQLREGDAERAFHFFGKAGKIGKKFNNTNLVTLSRLGRGQALVLENKIQEGTTMLDEAMIAVIADETSPIVSGIVYCAVIETCQRIYDLRRAQEWTEALSRWCDSQQGLVPYRGECLIRRAEIMEIQGKWKDAISEASQASELFLKRNSSRPAGEAFYLQAELHRLRGDFDHAEEAYGQASKWGCEPQPGLALLRMAQGKLDAAESAIRRVEKEKKNMMVRSKILPAYIEIMIAGSDIQAAEAGAKELTEIAAEFQSTYLKAIATQAEGKLLLINDEPAAALDKLMDAWAELKRMGAAYEAAQTRVSIGFAYRNLGDDDTAEMELDAARWIFQQLGAKPDLLKINALFQKEAIENTYGLTPREIQVLRHLVTGKTNKEIGSDLFISERTVDRHVSNIFGKLDVPSRAAATAFAYEHDLT